MKIKTIVTSLVALMIVALIASCASHKEGGEEPNPNPNPNPGGEQIEETMINFAIRLPAHAKPENPSIYAITEKEEDHVKTIEVLLFTNEGYTGKPYYCSVISDDGGAGVTNKKKFTISLPIGGPYTVVLLSNSKDIVDAALKDRPDLKGGTKSDVLKLLEKEQLGKWNTTSNANFDPIPMWGEIMNVTVKRGMSLECRLARMVSRVNVELGVDAKTQFKLNAVHLYNRYTKGMLVPYELSWNGAKATDPSIPTGSEANTTPQIYNVTNDESILGEIYAFEAPVEADDQKSTCLILEGEYQGVKTFYRVDFATKDGAAVNFLPLLRNHSYDISISAIKGLGTGSAKEAFEEGTDNAGNLDYDVIVIDDSDITTIIYNGKYMLGFSQDEFLLSKLQHAATDTDNILMVMSNVPGGWKIDEISYEVGGAIDWLSIAAGEMEGEGDGNKKNVSLLLDANTGIVERVGYLHFSAGRLKYKIKVTQRHPFTLGVDKTLFDDTDGFGMGHEMYLSEIDSLFNISSNTSWEIVSSHPGVLLVDQMSGTGSREMRVILQPSPLYIPKDDYTLTITGVGVDDPIVITVKQFGMDIYVDNDRGTANRAMPNANFVTACKAHDPSFDGGDGGLSIAEAVSYSSGELKLISKSIASLKGVEYFRNLTMLDCKLNSLTTLDVSKNTKLTTLRCDHNQLTELNVRMLTSLTIIYSGNNQISELDLTNNTKLTNIGVEYNLLTKLDVSKNLELTDLTFNYNSLTELDVSKNTKLLSLYSAMSPLKELDLSNNLELTRLACQSNQLTKLDVTKNTELTFLFCESNQLTDLDVTKNTKLTILICHTNQISELDLSQIRVRSVRAQNLPLHTVYVWWGGIGGGGKPFDWEFPPGFNNYVYREQQ